MQGPKDYAVGRMLTLYFPTKGVDSERGEGEGTEIGGPIATARRGSRRLGDKERDLGLVLVTLRIRDGLSGTGPSDLSPPSPSMNSSETLSFSARTSATSSTVPGKQLAKPSIVLSRWNEVHTDE